VSDTYEYDAFGNAVNKTGATPNNYLYRGEQFDPTSAYIICGRDTTIPPRGASERGPACRRGPAPLPIRRRQSGGRHGPNGSEDLIEYALVPHIFPPCGFRIMRDR